MSCQTVQDLPKGRVAITRSSPNRHTAGSNTVVSHSMADNTSLNLHLRQFTCTCMYPWAHGMYSWPVSGNNHSSQAAEEGAAAAPVSQERACVAVQKKYAVIAYFRHALRLTTVSTSTSTYVMFPCNSSVSLDMDGGSGDHARRTLDRFFSTITAYFTS
ncbi:hypothetical protein BC835DRAFT_552660 [Cytidiella melzeri]|nr:hypothetical protein BC835DRAFT_552660 [Cytidiella melzeri]